MLTAYRRLFEMMSPPERKRFWLLVTVTFFLSFFEVASVISILPFLRLLSEPSLIESTPALNWAYTTGGFESTRSFLVWTGVVVFIVTVVGLLLKVISIWMSTRFALMRSYSFSARLLANYLHQPYEWFLERHSAELGNSILAEVDKVVSEALLPAMRMIPEFFTVILLVLALCLIEPEIALGGALLLGGLYGLIFVTVRRILSQLGRERFMANRTRFHVVQEATGGLKELKIMGLEAGFLDRFRHAAFRMARAQTRTQVISNVPRQAIEAVAFGGMIALILYLLVRGDGDITAMIPTLGLIAAAGMRLIPALQQLYYRNSYMRQSEAALMRIHEDLTSLSHTKGLENSRDTSRLALKERLELRSLGYSYPTADRTALNDMTLTIDANTTVGIVGSTGAGKTTLVDIVLGLLVPNSGDIVVDGTVITDKNRHAWQRTIGYVPQNIFLSDGTLAENIAFGLPKDQIDMDAVERAARIAALHDLAMTELPEGYDTHVGERGTRLSGGQRQRVGIARALYHDPAMLIFDEATSALDTVTEAAVIDAVHRIAGQKTIVMIAHRLSTIRDCDTIHMLRAGRVAASGSFNDLIEADEEFHQMATAAAPVK